LIKVTLPANVNLGDGNDPPKNPAFDNGLDEYYNKHGKKAGVYTLAGVDWSYQEQ
jgi:hypothetical protein